MEAVIKTEQLFDENEQQQKLFACQLVKTEDVPKNQSFDILNYVDSDEDVNCDNLKYQVETEDRISTDELDTEVPTYIVLIIFWNWMLHVLISFSSRTSPELLTIQKRIQLFP